MIDGKKSEENWYLTQVREITSISIRVDRDPPNIRNKYFPHKVTDMRAALPAYSSILGMIL
jgi:hypothetical protein